MQVLQAGQHKLILLELDADTVAAIARQAGFDCRIKDNAKSIVAEISIPDRPTPLLLFDASDPANLGWFSRCQFYVDGRSGAVLQTPISVANQKDRHGRPVTQSLLVQILKELPANFRLPGKQPVNEQVVYAVLSNFLAALLNNGVGVCGGPVVKPLAGRSEAVGPRN